ncbi:hypothetical protein G4B88_022184 [Cannabis sativa]|uniref:Sulfotransferase n=1 Tax=Cannabis sativa TaxID=3483 RepID=A0A7J6FY89_CANSA|nr:hypothetical protein G4B88_022184 [Cannabis sativa]
MVLFIYYGCASCFTLLNAGLGGVVYRGQIVFEKNLWIHRFYLERKIADFLGFPFSTEEENRGVPKQIEQLCSVENMKKLDVTKNGKHYSGFPNSAFIRKGEREQGKP